LDELIIELCIKRGHIVPGGVMARQIDERHYLYLNVSGEAKDIQLKENLKSILTNKLYSNGFATVLISQSLLKLNKIL